MMITTTVLATKGNETSGNNDNDSTQKKQLLNSHHKSSHTSSSASASNELDTSWHTSSHSVHAREQQQQEASVSTWSPSSTTHNCCHFQNNIDSQHQPVRRGSVRVRDKERRSSLGSVTERCCTDGDVDESTRTLSVETHGITQRHQPSNKMQDDSDNDDDDVNQLKMKNRHDLDLSDDDDYNDEASFAEASLTEETTAENLEKCLATGVSKRLVNFRINYDSNAFSIDDTDDDDRPTSAFSNRGDRRNRRPLFGFVGLAWRRFESRRNRKSKP